MTERIDALRDGLRDFVARGCADTHNTVRMTARL